MVNEARSRVPSAAANGKMGHSLISEKKFRQLYETALRLHLVARRDGSEGGWVRGREAVLAGVSADLRSDDVVVAADAASVDEILRGHASMRMDRRSFEERVIEALCDAVGDRMRKTGRITAIFPEGGQRGAILEEARALAITAKLPVLLVEDEPPGKKAKSAKSRKGAATTWEYPLIPVDTQDVIAMYRVAHESIARARDGGGPTHLVGVRWQPATKGRQRAAKSEGPVEHLEQWLIARGLPAMEWRREIVAEFEARSSAGDMDEADTVNGVTENDSAETRAIA
jgi:hypothetical protein